MLDKLDGAKERVNFFLLHFQKFTLRSYAADKIHSHDLLCAVKDLELVSQKTILALSYTN